MAELDSYVEAYNDEFPYALDNRLMLNWYPQRIIEMAQGESALELGLGHGYSSNIFARHFKKYFVIEGSIEVIGQFQKKNPISKVEIIVDYFERFSSESKFDNIIMGFVLEHVDDPVFILKKYKNMLTSKGCLFVAVPNGEALNKRIGYEAGLIRSLWDLGPADVALGHKRLFSVALLHEIVRESGLKIEATEGILLKPITTAQIQELKLSEEILQAMMRVGVSYPELCVGILMKLSVA